MKTLHCLTCHQPLPEGHEHPPAVGHSGVGIQTPVDLQDSIDSLFASLIGLQQAIYELADTADHETFDHDAIVCRLAWLGEELSGELQRRINWLYKLSRSAQAQEEG